MVPQSIARRFDRLIKGAAADAVTTTYTMRLDADCAVGHNLPNAIAAAAADGADICSVKVLAANRRHNACTRFQALEYDMAMLSRHYRPWLVSGAGVVARTLMLREILRRHSMSPIGEDIEMGRIAYARRMRIRHLDVVIEADVPDSWRALFRQRRLWWAGNFRHSVVNFDRNALQLPMWTLYNLSIFWVTVHLRVWRYPMYLIKAPVTFLVLMAVVIVVSAVTTLIANLQVRAPLMAVFPLYAMVQSTLIMSVGACWYLRLLAKTRKTGRYRFAIRRRGLRVLTVGVGRWSGAGPILYAYQWQVSCDGEDWADIPAATRNTLAVATPLHRMSFRALVTATNGAGSATACSAAVAG